LSTSVRLGRFSQQSKVGGACLPLQVLTCGSGIFTNSSPLYGSGMVLLLAGRCHLPLTATTSTVNCQTNAVVSYLLVKRTASASWRNLLTQIVRLSWVCTRHFRHIQIRPGTQQAAALSISGLMLQRPSPHGETDEHNADAYRKYLLVDKYAQRRSTVARS